MVVPEEVVVGDGLGLVVGVGVGVNVGAGLGVGGRDEGKSEGVDVGACEISGLTSPVGNGGRGVGT